MKISEMKEILSRPGFTNRGEKFERYVSIAESIFGLTGVLLRMK